MLTQYLNERIAKGDPAPRIPLHMACGKNGICGFSVNDGIPIVLPMHRHSYYELFITLSDDVIHVFPDRQIPIARNTIVLVRPDDAHTQLYEQMQPGKRLMNVTFALEVMDNVFEFLAHAGIEKEAFLSPAFPPSRVLSEMQSREYVLEFEKRLQFYAMDESLLCRNIYSFLCYVFFNLFSAPESEYKKVVHPPYWLEVTCEKMKRFENFYEGLPRMVEISGKTQEHLARSMKKYYGMTTSQYINDLRLSYAVSKLVNAESEDSMLEVILDSGFQSPGHFYKLFAEKYGMTPKEYRKKRL